MREQLTLSISFLILFMLSISLGPEEPALTGYLEGHVRSMGFQQKGYPDGSVVFFDLLGTEQRTMVEESRRATGVMEKDAKKFFATGDRSFGRIQGGTPEGVITDPKVTCTICHPIPRERDSVFNSSRK